MIFSGEQIKTVIEKNPELRVLPPVWTVSSHYEAYMHRYASTNAANYNTFTLTYYPGCCGIGMISDINSNNPAAILALAETLIAGSPKGRVEYTTVPHQVGIIDALKVRDWVEESSFRNPSSGNTVTKWSKTF